MANICLTYLFCIFTGGSVILTIFSIMSFIGAKGMNLKYERRFSVGCIFIINALIYGAIAYYLSHKLSEKEEKLQSKVSSLDNVMELPILKQT